MICVIYEREQYRLTARGHAGFAPYGQDIVCAGVSALMQTLQRVAGQMEAKGAAETGGCVVNGFGSVRCVPCKGSEDRVHTVMDTVAAGLEALAEAYPDCVSYAHV